MSALRPSQPCIVPIPHLCFAARTIMLLYKNVSAIRYMNDRVPNVGARGRLPDRGKREAAIA